MWIKNKRQVFFCTSFDISQFQTNSIWTMERSTIEQRVKVIQAYYENGRSNQNAYRELRDFFGQFNRPNARTIGKIVQKFEQTGSVGDVQLVLQKILLLFAIVWLKSRPPQLVVVPNNCTSHARRWWTLCIKTCIQTLTSCNWLKN